jgi:hypothetical protein
VVKTNPASVSLSFGSACEIVVSKMGLRRAGYPDFRFAFHDAVEVGPTMLAKVAK